MSYPINHNFCAPDLSADHFLKKENVLVETGNLFRILNTNEQIHLLFFPHFPHF